jgi:hypothetical protein
MLRQSRWREAKLTEELVRAKYSFDRQVGTQPSTGRTSETVQSSSEMQRLVPQVPVELIQACISGNCILFAGSGLAAQAGLPTWTELLAQFLTAVEKKEGSADWSGLREQLLSGEAGPVVDLLVARSKTQQLIEALGSAYGGKPVIPEAIREPLTAIPFSGALTTNFDRVLETSSAWREPQVVTLRSRTNFTELLRARRFFVLKLHGDVNDPTSVVMGADQFAQAFAETPNLRTFIGSLFSSQTFLFVGASLPGIEWFITTTGIKPSSSTRHFALVSISS